MSQSLSVKNFGPIKNLNITVSDFLILIGEQAAGKSTIAKLIYFFKSLKHDLAEYLYDDSEIQGKLEQEFILKIRRKFTPDFFGTTKHMPPFSLKYNYKKNGYLEILLNEDAEKINISFGQNAYGELLNICAKIEGFRTKYFKQNKGLLSAAAYRALELEKRNEIRNIEAEINAFLGDDKDTFFIPAGRSILATLSEQLQIIDTHDLDFLMKAFLQRIQRLKKGFNVSLEELVKDAKSEDRQLSNFDYLDLATQKINEILKGRYHIDTSGEKIFYDNENFVKLNLASSGQQEVLWILLQLFSFMLHKEQVFLVIEEPEAHLYPVAQKQLVELMTLFVNLTNSQLIITTHSPYIISSFNNLVYAHNIGSTKKQAAEKIIRSEMWIDFSRINAFKVTNGAALSINDEELRLLKAEEIDYASAIINEEFNHLFDLEDL